MPECTLRQFRTADGEWLREWFQSDAAGMAQFMGFALPTEADCIQGFNNIFTAVQQRLAQFWMVEREAEPIGFIALTEIPPEQDRGLVHIYIEPSQRRYSLKAAKAGEMAFSLQGFKHLVATQHRDNRAAYALARRMGFAPHPTVVLQKALDA